MTLSKQEFERRSAIHSSIMRMATAANTMLTRWNNDVKIDGGQLGIVEAEVELLVKELARLEEEEDEQHDEYDGGPDNIREERI